MSYIDVMMYGDEHERLRQSFELMDIRGQGETTFGEFKSPMPTMIILAGKWLGSLILFSSC